MTLREKWYNSPRLRLLGAALLNALVLAGMLLVMQPLCQANDDFEIMSFVDGQRAVKEIYIPYLNIVFSAVLRLVYTVFGDALPWFAIIQYMLMFSSFTAMSYVFFDRLRLWQGTVLSIIMLLLIGASCYIEMTYTKTAAVCTVGGLALMAQLMQSPLKNKLLPLIAAMFLTVSGAMLRFMEFMPCAALMLPLFYPPRNP